MGLFEFGCVGGADHRLLDTACCACSLACSNPSCCASDVELVVHGDPPAVGLVLRRSCRGEGCRAAVFGDIASLRS